MVSIKRVFIHTQELCTLSTYGDVCVCVWADPFHKVTSSTLKHKLFTSYFQNKSLLSLHERVRQRQQNGECVGV